MDLMEDERQQDVKEVATRMLVRLKKEYGEDAASNDTPEGRMIYQLEWILRSQREGILFLPVDERMISTLLYCYMEHSDVVAPLKDADRLLNLLWRGNYLMKPSYFHLIIKEVDELLEIIPPHYPEMYKAIHDRREKEKAEWGGEGYVKELWALMANGEASPDRQGLAAFPLIPDLHQMKKDCKALAIEPPIGVDERKQRYPAYDITFRHSLFRNELRHIYIRIRRISALVVEGRRPNEEGIIHGSEGW